MPKLLITFPNGDRVTHDLLDATITVGRLPDNAIALDDISVSSHHAELTFEEGDYLLKDLGSTNGTKVNGERGTEWKLADGDIINFGKVIADYSSEVPSTKHVLPEAQGRTVELGNESHRPSDFANASKFKTKTKKKDSAAVGIVSFAVVAILTFLAAVGMIFMLQAPV